MTGMTETILWARIDQTLRMGCTASMSLNPDPNILLGKDTMNKTRTTREEHKSRLHCTVYTVLLY